MLSLIFQGGTYLYLSHVLFCIAGGDGSLPPPVFVFLLSFVWLLREGMVCQIPLPLPVGGFEVAYSTCGIDKIIFCHVCSAFFFFLSPFQNLLFHELQRCQRIPRYHFFCFIDRTSADSKMSECLRSRISTVILMGRHLGYSMYVIFALTYHTPLTFNAHIQPRRVWVFFPGTRPGITCTYDDIKELWNKT